jgi:hypothetical protein
VSFIEWSSDQFGRNGIHYSVVKFRFRRQWALCVHRKDGTRPVAYFRDAAEARRFCRALGLDITDLRENADGTVVDPEAVVCFNLHTADERTLRRLIVDEMCWVEELAQDIGSDAVVRFGPDEVVSSLRASALMLTTIANELDGRQCQRLQRAVETATTVIAGLSTFEGCTGDEIHAWLERGGGPL